MLDREYNEAEVMEMFKEDGRQEGVDTLNKLNTILAEAGRLDDLVRAAKDTEYQKQLIRELVDINYK